MRMTWKSAWYFGTSFSPANCGVGLWSTLTSALTSPSTSACTSVITDASIDTFGSVCALLQRPTSTSGLTSTFARLAKWRIHFRISQNRWLSIFQIVIQPLAVKLLHNLQSFLHSGRTPLLAGILRYIWQAPSFYSFWIPLKYIDRMRFIIKLFTGLFLTSKLCCLLELSITWNRADIPGMLALVGLFEAIGLFLLIFLWTLFNILHWCNIQLIIIAFFNLFL